MKITLTYFKPYGKYYSGGELEFPNDEKPWDIAKYVRRLLSTRTLPGLVPNHGYYHVLITGDDDYVPILIMEPDVDE